MIGKEGLAEPRRTLRAGQVGPADQPAEAPIAAGIAGQENEVRATRPVADPAEVLLDGLATAGQPSPFRSGPGRQALARGGGRVRGSSGRSPCWPARPAAGRSPGRDDDPIGIRGERIEELDLHSDHRMQTGFAGRRRKPDDPVQTTVIGHGQARQAQGERPLDELVDRRCAVEEREVRVAMEFGVGHGQ